MARQARIKSMTGIYHVMLKGIDSRNIFMDDEDKMYFMENLKRAKERGEFKLYAYCLMDNHVHLLLKEGEEVGVSIKRITVGYGEHKGTVLLCTLLAEEIRRFCLEKF